MITADVTLIPPDNETVPAPISDKINIKSLLALSSFTTGIILKLNAISKIILILLMLAGRVGIIYFIFNICDRQKTTIDEEVEEMEVIVG